MDMRYLKTVSYTHLDVYKRQEFISTANTLMLVNKNVKIKVIVVINLNLFLLLTFLLLHIIYFLFWYLPCKEFHFHSFVSFVTREEFLRYHLRFTSHVTVSSCFLINRITTVSYTHLELLLPVSAPLSIYHRVGVA